MHSSAPVPHFEHLATFAGDLRTWVFSSQAEAARHFGVTHTTVSRYENGRLTPPVGYLASLTQLILARLAGSESQVVAHQEQLLNEINQAVRMGYPDQPLLHTWADLLTVSASYAAHTKERRPAPGVQPLPVAHQAYVDWGEAPDVKTFVGRAAELTQLTAWVRDPRCRLVAILGMGGVGKTTLATRLVEEVRGDFDFVIWRSLRSAPQIDEILQEFGSVLALQVGELKLRPFEMDRTQMIHYMRQHRCLLVLDNLESIMHDGDEAGHFRPGYAAYGDTLRRVADGRHQSCLLLTGRERPTELDSVAGEHGATRALRLGGMDAQAAATMLADYHLRGSDTGWQTLVAAYAGNPLALRLAADLIAEVYDGAIDPFLASASRIVAGVRRLLDVQCARLTPLERELVYWLAAACEPLTPQRLAADLVHPPAGAALADALHSLRRRSLVERSGASFLLQAVVAEYVTTQLTQRLVAEIVAGEIALLDQVALIMAAATEDVRQTQVRLLLAPVAEQVATAFDRRDLRGHCWQLLSRLRTRAGATRGYGAGNLLNLLLHLGYDLEGADFSGLTIHQADLRDATLRNVDFSHADLTDSVFSTTFAGVNAVALSPDSRLLAVATGQQVRVWEIATSQTVLILTGHADLVWDVAFDRTGRFLASGSADRSVRFWDLATGSVISTWLGHTHWVWAVALSADGVWLASGSEDCTVRVWNLATGELAGVLDTATGPVRALAFDPQTTHLVAGSADGNAYLWRLPDLHLVRRLGEPGAGLMAVAFDLAGDLLAAGGVDQIVRVWCVATGALLHAWRGHTAAIADVAIGAGGRIVASASYDHTVGLWSLDPALAHRIFHGHSQAVRSLAFDAGGDQLVTGSYDQSVRLWDTRTGHLLRLFHGHTFEVKAVAFSPDGVYVASGAADRGVRMWERATGRLLHTLTGHDRWVAAVAFHPVRPVLASASYDRTVRLWDCSSGQSLLTLPDQDGWLWAIAFHPSGDLIAAAGAAGVINLWDIHSGSAMRSLRGHARGIWCVVFSPDGALLASGGDDWAVGLWDVASGELRHVLHGHRGRIAALAFSPDGALLASAGCDGLIHVWAVDSGQLVRAFAYPGGSVCALAFSADGACLMASSEAHLLLVWEMAHGVELAALPRSGAAPTALAFDGAGAYLAGGALDGAIDLWRAPDGACAGALRIARPYEGMDITGATGLSDAQRATLCVLGAVEKIPANPSAVRNRQTNQAE